MSLIAIENFLEFAEGAVAVKDNLPSEINAAELESILVGHGVVLLYAHMEQCFQRALEIKCGHCTNTEVRTFALSVKDDKTGKLKLESVKDTLKRFGIDHKNRFSPQLEASNLKDAWDSVVNHRKTVAHYGQPAALTLSDLRDYYQAIRKVLGLICTVLSLTGQEIASISTLIILPGLPADSLHNHDQHLDGANERYLPRR